MSSTTVSLKSANNNPYFRLDASLIEQCMMSNILNKLGGYGLDFTTLSELGFRVWSPPRMAMKKLRLSKSGLRTLFAGVGIAKKMSINLSKIEIGYVPNEDYLVNEGYILVPETGEPACGYVFEGAIDALHSYYDDEPPLAATHNLFRITCESCGKELKRYIALLLNTSIGISIMKFAKYGALQPHYRADILARAPIPLLEKYKNCELLNKALDHEVKAWKAYFRTMKIIEEYFGEALTKICGTSRLTIVKNTRRLDGSGLLAINLLGELAEQFGKTTKLHDTFDIKSGNVPRYKKYKGVVGTPYITIDSIDDSGIIDYEKIAFIPEEKCERLFTMTNNRDILLVKDGIGSLGKIAIVSGKHPVMSGIFILRHKGIEDELLYYIAAILKTSLYGKIMEMLSYGTTGQISLTKHDIENILIPILDNYREIGSLFKKFVENLYEANTLKKQIIEELNNYFLKLIT